MCLLTANCSSLAMIFMRVLKKSVKEDNNDINSDFGYFKL